MGSGYDEYCCDRCARDAVTAQKRAEAGLQPMPDIVAGDLDEVLRLREVIERFDTLEEFASLRAENEKLRACLAEFSGAGVEYDAGKYLVVQVHHETLVEARELLGRP